MNNPLIKTALFIRDLLIYDESLIKIGRAGYEIQDYDIAYIAVDSLGSVQTIGTGKKFDSVAESMKYYKRQSIPMVLSFYGIDAWDRANNFSLLIASQKSTDLQRTLGIAVFNTQSITDVKLLAGQQYGERIELTFNLQLTNDVDVATLRIDTSQLSISSENGLEYS